jgi:hypothetical protein
LVGCDVLTDAGIRYAHDRVALFDCCIYHCISWAVNGEKLLDGSGRGIRRVQGKLPAFFAKGRRDGEDGEGVTGGQGEGKGKGKGEVSESELGGFLDFGKLAGISRKKAVFC